MQASEVLYSQEKCKIEWEEAGRNELQEITMYEEKLHFEITIDVSILDFIRVCQGEKIC
jgi:uncharacterized OsmC-like protein